MADWSLLEVEAVVADYFAMLEMELRGETFNKADRNRQLRRVLNGRSNGSVEFKHQNISAVLVNHNLPYVAGYKPRQNYQALLERVVLERFEAERDLPGRILESKAFTPSETPPVDFTNLASLEETPPERRPLSQRTGGRVTKIDFVERDARNARLGRLGEEWVLEYERQRLYDAGQPVLSKQVRHVSVELGDGLGYDIRSFRRSGEPLLIEVKTTGLGKSFPFYVSRNEVECSKREAQSFELYRVFEFSRAPRMFRLKGDLEKACVLEPTAYRARW